MPATFPLSRKKITLARVRTLLAVGLLLVAAVAAGASYADTLSPGATPLSTLVKFNDRDYEVSYADWVSLEPISTATVRKIEFGRVSEVNIATTATGTYSSDGMVSPHVQYPGINVRAVPNESDFYYPIWRPMPGTYIYTLNRTPSGARVFNSMRPSGTTSCVSQKGMLVCSRY